MPLLVLLKHFFFWEIEIQLLKVLISVYFSIFSELCEHDQNVTLEYLHLYYPITNLTLLIFPFLLLAFATSDLFSYLTDLPILDTSFHSSVCSLFCDFIFRLLLSSFTHNTYQYFVSYNSKLYSIFIPVAREAHLLPLSVYWMVSLWMAITCACITC